MMKSKTANEDIRRTMRENVVRQWELAEKLGVSEATVSKMFRHELGLVHKTQIIEAVREIIADHLKEV